MPDIASARLNVADPNGLTAVPTRFPVTHGGLCERRRDPLSSCIQVQTASAAREVTMAKAHWREFYRSISNPDAMPAYAKLAGPAISASGGRLLSRGNAAEASETSIFHR